jgi:hypothetical protein
LRQFTNQEVVENPIFSPISPVTNLYVFQHVFQSADGNLYVYFAGIISKNQIRLTCKKIRNFISHSFLLQRKSPNFLPIIQPLIGDQIELIQLCPHFAKKYAHNDDDSSMGDASGSRLTRLDATPSQRCQRRVASSTGANANAPGG